MRKFVVRTNRRCDILDITPLIRTYLAELSAADGLLTVFCPHTTAGITVNENADPDVRRDLSTFLDRTIPPDPHYAHSEGNSDAHIKSTLTNSSQLLIVQQGQVMLGRWQGVYFMEYDGPRSREVWFYFMPENPTAGR
jgi:secondary thiamine-phosphate synthase enzyme